jgi:hypothetical protein
MTSTVEHLSIDDFLRFYACTMYFSRLVFAIYYPPSFLAACHVTVTHAHADQFSNFLWSLLSEDEGKSFGNGLRSGGGEETVSVIATLMTHLKGASNRTILHAITTPPPVHCTVYRPLGTFRVKR